MFQNLRLSDLSRIQTKVLRRPTTTRPIIRQIEANGLRAVVKDFSVNGFVYRNMFGRLLVWRESRAYRRLAGIPGVPRLYGVMNGLALVMEEIPGRSLEKLEKETKLPPSFFDSMEKLITRCHRRGIAHCDLKRAPNTMLGPEGEPYLIDWAASISESECSLPLLRQIYERFLLDDYLAVIKLKLRHVPEAVSIEERIRYGRKSPAEKVIRSIRDRLRSLLQHVA